MKYFTVSHNNVHALGEFNSFDSANRASSIWHKSSIYPAVCVNELELAELAVMVHRRLAEALVS